MSSFSTVICKYCNKTFRKEDREIKRNTSGNHFCSVQCTGKYYCNKIELECEECGKLFKRSVKEIKKSTDHFCSNSCAATYNNGHKRHGYRRSQLEIYIEDQLINLYPDLEIRFNKRDTIWSELDIYIPKFKLAFELSGIMHQVPIFGEETFSRCQNNDKKKIKLCKEADIKLYVINTSEQKKCTPETSQVYLNFIINIINQFKYSIHEKCKVGIQQT